MLAIQFAMQRVDVLDLRTMEGDGGCGNIMVGGKDMSPLMYCILLKCAADTTLEVKFRANDTRLKVKGHIYAYYGPKFPYVDDSVVKGFYMTSLLEPGMCVSLVVV
ncbi:hypothetical protein Tco_0994351 [Tanacetum coccineum]